MGDPHTKKSQDLWQGRGHFPRKRSWGRDVCRGPREHGSGSTPQQESMGSGAEGVDET